MGQKSEHGVATFARIRMNALYDFLLTFSVSLWLKEHVGTKMSLRASKITGFHLQATVCSSCYSGYTLSGSSCTAELYAFTSHVFRSCGMTSGVASSKNGFVDGHRWLKDWTFALSRRLTQVGWIFRLSGDRTQRIQNPHGVLNEGLENDDLIGDKSSEIRKRKKKLFLKNSKKTGGVLTFGLEFLVEE